MENPVNSTISALKNLADFRYKTELAFLKSLEEQTSRIEGTPFNTFFRSGLKMSKIFVDSRYNLEKQMLDGFQPSTTHDEQQETDSLISIEKINKPKPIPSGTIKVVTPKRELVTLPLDVRNHRDQEQEIEVVVTALEGAGKGNTPIDQFLLRNPKELVQANASTKFYLDINSNDDRFKPGETYTAKVLIKGQETRSFDLIIAVIEKKENGQDKPLILFVPPAS